jgi:2-oxoglutarate ferredoxin oxidoreductase subunit beta
VREHQEATATFDFVPIMREIKTNYEEGSIQSLEMHDGSVIQLHKLAKDWNPLDRVSAMSAIQSAKSKNEILTGLLYINSDSRDLHDLIQTSERPLNSLPQSELCPGAEILDGINNSFR